MNEKSFAQNSLVSPYVGLMPFTESDADYFFGRTTDVEVAATNLRAACLTIFYGASGVGKSSLLNAGVVPYLQKIAANSVLPDESPEFILLVLREWANNPLDSLRLRIKEEIERAVCNKKIPHLRLSDVEKTARANAQNRDLCLLLNNWADLIKTDFLIIFDQFEDFFLHPEFLNGAGSFGEEFPKAVNSKDLPANFMLSLRDDAIAKLDFFKGKIQEPMKNTLRLLHLDRASTTEAIRKPLMKYNEKMGTSFTIEDELVEKLLEDVQVDKIKFDTQGQANVNPVEAERRNSPRKSESYQVETPYLQLVMMRLWKDENTQREQRLALDTLISEEKLGGVQRIVETHLDDVMEHFEDADKELASEFIHFTVTRSGTKVPLDANDLAELAELPDRKPDIERILRQLSSGETRIFKIMLNRRNRNNPFYEVAHDALGPAILSWRKRQNDIKLQRLERQAEEEKRREEIAALEAVRQAELAEEERQKAEQAAKLNEEKERRIYQEKLLTEERRSRKFGRIIFALATFAIVVSLGAASIYFKFQEGEKQREIDSIAANDQAKLENERVKQEMDDKLNQKLKDTEKEITQFYEERVNRYKSLIDIIKDLQSGRPKGVRTGLNRLKEKAKNDDLPLEYKPLLTVILKDTQIPAQDEPLKTETLAAVEGSQAKIAKPTSVTPTIIFIQIQNPDPNAAALKILLEKNDYLAPGIDNVGAQPAIKQNQLRYFRDGDATLAAKICDFLAQHGINAMPVRVSGYENSPLVRPKQFELWFTAAPIPDVQ